MNRDEMIVRYWHKDEEKYLKTQSLALWMGCYVEVTGSQHTNGMWYSNIGKTYNDFEIEVEHCTGLKDKNDAFIFENDIIVKRFYDRPYSSKQKYKDKKCLVYFENGSYHFKPLKETKDDYTYIIDTNWNNMFGDCEIIGNIHTIKKALN